MTCLKAQGLPTVLPIIQLPSSTSTSTSSSSSVHPQPSTSTSTSSNSKKLSVFKKAAQRYFHTEFGNDIQTVTLSTHAPSVENTGIDASTSQQHHSNGTEIQQLFRWLGETRLKPIHWRSNRSYMLVCISSSVTCLMIISF